MPSSQTIRAALSNLSAHLEYINHLAEKDGNGLQVQNFQPPIFTPQHLSLLLIILAM